MPRLRQTMEGQRLKHRLEQFGITPIYGVLNDAPFELTLNDRRPGQHRLIVDGVDLSDRLSEITITARQGDIPNIGIWLDERAAAIVEFRR